MSQICYKYNPKLFWIINLSHGDFSIGILKYNFLNTKSGFLAIGELYSSVDNCVNIFSPIVIENNEILYRDYVDISVAVATPKVCKHAASGPSCSKADNAIRRINH